MVPTNASDRRCRATVRVEIPACRDPFINTPLLSVGRDAEGVERFWISTWNSVTGCLGALVDENGGFRIYPFYEPKHPGFYSAVAEDTDTLWLCGNLSQVVRLSLSTGHYEAFATGAPGALVFHGMALDPGTGKLFAAAYPQTPAGTTAVSFDTRARVAAAIHEGIAPDYYQHGSFPNGDGTYSIVLECPGTSLVRWDPRTETVTGRRVCEEFDIHHALETGSNYRLVQLPDGRVYFPGLGWLHRGRDYPTAEGPRPALDMTWFGVRGQAVYGARYRDGDVTLGRWDMETGAVEEVARVADAVVQSVNLTRTGKLVCVSVYGDFTCLDAETGRLELSRRLPATSIQHVDCLRRIDEKRLLGTPFITQRFWEVNLETGEGFDCGRAAPGAGEIMQTWKVGGKVYMAEYGGGRLVEYDPSVHPHYPENPRVVANPPESMRPITAADDGRCLYYFSSAPYGRVGSTLTKYDTVTGQSIFAVNPVPGQRFVSLHLDAARDSLVAGGSYDADCRAGTPLAEVCVFARFATDDLRVLAQTEAPQGTQTATVLGPLGDDRWLCQCVGAFTVQNQACSRILVELDGASFSVRRTLCATPEGWQSILYAGTPGRFVLHVGETVELWGWDPLEGCGYQDRVLATGAAGRRLLLDGDSLYLLGNHDIVVIDGALPPG